VKWDLLKTFLASSRRYPTQKQTNLFFAVFNTVSTHHFLICYFKNVDFFRSLRHLFSFSTINAWWH